MSVTLYFSPERYAIGDTINGANPFIIKKVICLGQKMPLGIQFLFPTLWVIKLGRMTKKITLKDTMAVESISLDAKFVPEWLQLRPDTNVAVINYGIALIPQDNSTIINSIGAEE